MTIHELRKAASGIEAEVARASFARRCAMQPAVQNMVRQFEAEGLAVPASLKALDDALMQDVIEARFDNMPV